MYANPWSYQNREFTSDDIGDNLGFVYLIINTENDMRYIGKKIFKRVSHRMVNKKKKKVLKESDWKTYYGSNPIIMKEVKEKGAEKFKRIILRLCQTKSEMSYFELEEQIMHNALLSEKYYNEYIHVRVNAKNIIR